MTGSDTRLLRQFFERRLDMLERQGKLPRPDAEREALRITSCYARNKLFSWGELREAVAGYPLALSLVPAREGAVDSLPDGPPRYAVRSTGAVVRQGELFETCRPRRVA